MPRKRKPAAAISATVLPGTLAAAFARNLGSRVVRRRGGC